MLEKIPPELRSRRQWVLWRYDKIDGKPQKMPYQPNCKKARTNDRSTWVDFAEAVAALDDGKFEGLGFVFCEDDPYIGIDFDGCRDPKTGQFEPWAKNWIKRLASYAELSPSATGAKVWIKAEPVFESGKSKNLDFKKVSDKAPGIEVYSQKRFFCVTGQILAGMPRSVKYSQEVLEAIKSKFWKPQQIRPVITNDLPSQQQLVERAAAYMEKVEPAISGQKGSNVTFRLACVLYCEFGLNEAETWQLLNEYNQRCQPPWSERELRHKLDDAVKQPRTFVKRDSANDDFDFSQVHYTPTAKTAPPETTENEVVTAKQIVLDELARPKEETTKLISTGVPGLDYCIGGGIEMGEVVVIAGRPSHCKSAIGLQMMHEISALFPCLMINEEMSKSALAKRMIKYLSNISEQNWDDNRANLQEDTEFFFKHRQPVYVASNVGTVEKTIEKIEHYVAKHGVKLVCIDYAQLLGAAGGNRYEIVSNMSREIKKVAKRLNVIVLMLCQLSRAIEERKEFVPQVSDLKESGQLEQDCDVLIGLVWMWQVDPKVEKHRFQLFILKNKEREIVQREAEIQFVPDRQKFGSKFNLTERERFTEFDDFDNGGDLIL